MNAQTEHSMDRQKSPEQLEDEIKQIRASLDDTLEAIQHRLSPGPLMNQAWDYLKSGPVQFSGNLGATIRDNPVPVSLLGIGLAWLMMSRPNGHTERAVHTVPGLDTSYLAYGAANPRDKSEQELDESTDPLAGHYQDPYDEQSYRHIMTDEEADPDRMAEAAGVEYSSTGSSGGRLRQAGRGARRAGARMGRMAHDTGGRFRKGARSARYTAAGYGDRFGEFTRDQADRVREGYQHMLHERPLVLGAIGVALGAAIGAAFPSTRREDEWMGTARDDLMDKAQATGQEQLEKASRVAEATGEAAQDAARDVKDAAKEEAQRQSDSSRQGL